MEGMPRRGFRPGRFEFQQTDSYVARSDVAIRLPQRQRFLRKKIESGIGISGDHRRIGNCYLGELKASYNIHCPPITIMNTNLSSPEEVARLNELQDAVIDAIRTSRDEIEDHFSKSGDSADLIDNTLQRLCSYLSDRSQAVSYLVSSGYVWDAEIVLRSFYEANAKVWFICLSDPSDRNTLVEEFWVALSAAHNRKQATRAKTSAELFRNTNRPNDEAVLAALTSEDLFNFGTDNKDRRRRLEQKWSFAEILKFLKANSPAVFETKYVEALSHGYGIASHLVHADEAALDLMLDRKLRPKDELGILARAHVCRIFSDQVSLWVFTVMSLAYRFGEQKRVSVDLKKKFEHVHDLSRHFTEAFDASQLKFYPR
jgi:Family of unknown function (DUF5677)